MCGIAGYFNLKGPAEAYLERLKKMLGMIQHRGPDGGGVYDDSHIVFGAVRLSIFDLAKGSQPMSDSSQRYWICFNGEIYNHFELRQELERFGQSRFRTHCDTEVALLAWIKWGEKAFERFNGPFTLAIYDEAKKELTLARDRYGKRSLFYTQLKTGEFVFSSEMKGFLSDSRIHFDFDKNALANICFGWTVLPGESPYHGINQLREGYFLVISKEGVVKNIGYAGLDFPEEKYKGTEEDGIRETRLRLERSVELRLRSDVEVGVYLSGGIDSTIVAYLAAQKSARPIRSFGIQFEEEEYDETNFQKEASSFLGLHHEAIRIGSKDIADSFPQALWHAEVPVFRTAFVPLYLLSELAQQCGMKAVLTGEGADETFLGYDLFKEVLVRQRWRTLSKETKKSMVSGLYPYLSHFRESSPGALLGMFEQFSSYPWQELSSHEMRFHNSWLSLAMFQGEANPRAAFVNMIYEEYPQYTKLSSIEQAQLLEFKTLLLGYLLSTQGDRMAFAHGVENRCPFLDPNVVSWAFSLPFSFRLRGMTREKHLLRKCFAREIPPSIIKRPKQPYRAPDASVFLTIKPDYLESILSMKELMKVPFLNHSFCERFIKKINRDANPILSPRENQAFMILLSTSLLHKIFVQKQYPSPLKEVSLCHENSSFH